MALRVLLADNSETIKKVIQLSLQELGVELRVISSGLDVVDVAEKFLPDVIFIDILLQKISGYEVSKKLKTHSKLKQIPVILMWSGFMELDEEKANEALADARLEKPFDADTIRNMVNKLVKAKPILPAQPTSSTGPINIRDHLDLDDTELEPTKIKPDLHLNLNNDQQQGEDFQQVNLGSLPEFAAPPTDSAEMFEVSENVQLEDFDVEFKEPEAVQGTDFLLNATTDTKFKITPTKTIPANGGVVSVNGASLTQTQLEELVKQQCHEIIEKMAWKMVPELSEKIIKDELQRLLKETDNKL